MGKPIILISSTLLFAILGLTIAYFETSHFADYTFMGGIAGFFVGGVATSMYKIKSN